MNWETVAVFVGLLATLVGTTLKLGAILQRFESLSTDWQDAAKLIPQLRHDVELVKDALGEVTARQKKHDSHITELRIKAGTIRRSQGDFGE